MKQKYLIGLLLVIQVGVYAQNKIEKANLSQFMIGGAIKNIYHNYYYKNFK